MGQREVYPREKNGRGRQAGATPMPNVAVFSTKIGWMGLIGRAGRVERLVFGHSSANSVWNAIQGHREEEIREADWHPALRKLLENYAAGQFADFSEVEVDLSHLTAFQNRVVSELRTVAYGQTLSYAELASRAGSPRAARAVGSVMARNRVPLIIPCHRVVGAGGHLGGFSAPRGVAIKKQLLDLEATRVGTDGDHP